MTQVSRKKVHKDVEEKMFETLWEAISALKSKEEIKNFINDLLSPPEKTMIAKRLAIAALLMRNLKYESIKDMLKVSQTTVSKVSITMKENVGYQNAINKIARSQAGKEFWRDVENLMLRMGIAKYTFAPDEQIKAVLKHKKKTLV